MNITATNVALLALGTGAMGTGIERIFSHDYIAGGVGLLAGIILFLIYEKFPTSPTSTTPTV